MFALLERLTRPQKRLIFLLADTGLIPITLYMAFALRYGTVTPMELAPDASVLFILLTVLGAGVIHLFGLPRIQLHTFENRATLQVGLTAASLVVLAISCSYMFRLPAPRSVPLIFGTLFFLSSVSMRVLGLLGLTTLADFGRAKRATVVIYGAGSGGAQLAVALRQAQEANPVAFIDDNSALHGLIVSGLRVYAASDLDRLIATHKVERVLVAIPSASARRRNELVDQLSNMDIEVQILPSYVEMMAGNGLDALRPVSPDELLGRDKVALDTPEIAKTYAGRIVMVTGAGGSIGSELCRQLLECRPERIVLFEQSEFALYEIDQDLRHRAKDAGIPITTRLGSVTNKARVASVIADEGVDIILHAAAYKHVPLVEENELEGARNNVLGTQTIAECAHEAGIERMILISTDKAVRPANIMGATKRMAELVIQDLQTRSTTTKFSMVRFGNVLGSSGSVLPLFQKQIAAGGPVTVTHTEVTRFFMTIPEAARLVLLAGAYATGGDVFVLDMGEPQKIIDIAHKMVQLSGRTVMDAETGVGDIAITITGLRLGEKLYEELLIDDDSLLSTPHPKILRAQEDTLPQAQVEAMIHELRLCVTDGDTPRLRALVKNRVHGYQDSKIDPHP